MNVLKHIKTTRAFVAKRLAQPSRQVLPVWPQQKHWNIIAVALLLMVATAFLFLDPLVQTWMQRDLGVWRQAFGALTYLGSSGWVLWGSGLLVIALSCVNWRIFSARQRMMAADIFADALFAFVAIAASGTLISFVKNLLGRARPRYFEELGPFHFEFAAFDSGFASFPSGHSTTFGALAMVLTLLFPRGWPFFLVFGVAGGLSRSVVGAHYISDIVAGLMFGAVFALLMARWLANKGVMFRGSASNVLPIRKRSLAFRARKGRAPDLA